MTKADLRRKYKEMRLQLSPGEIERFSERIVEQALMHFQLSEKTVSLFLPIERQREINTYLLLERAMGIRATVAVPKTDFETMEMHHYLFESTDQLEVSPKGIPEPKKGKVIAADRFDIVFVPLLAVDVKGNRVGYGKGFYDRFLRKCSPGCLFVGLHYFDVESKIDDVFPTDIRLNALVMPARVLRFN
ncbi:5-formyltetrahydrofolate cyclo-ligase [Fluviicola sp.]|uniref:5-formyltetrahydrofolate cyclo-ligase n=1 Tax=Fluviicola sp. TaxID=1917219 RepID=UPI00282E95CC|nr:5-formyltetrahydrofolate cyclo-ligase [Fluviicola sp.]MDR0801695.1 5-formyltetrahydrofolate cyclo-ligase [Fluviicola sp.]